MPKKLLTTAFWVLAPLATFALGWWLKSTSGGNGDSPGKAAGQYAMSTRSPSALTGTGKGADSGDAATKTELSDLITKLDLSSKEIENLGTRFKNSLDPIERRLAFSDLLRGLTRENAEEIREQIAHLRGDSAEFREFHFAWGKIAGTEAVMFGANTEKPDMSPALAGWASADPNAAMDWLLNLDMENDPQFDSLLKDRGIKAGDLRDHLSEGLVRGLASTDIDLATEFVFGRATTGHKNAGELLGIVAGNVLRAHTPGEAAAWAASLPVSSSDPFGEGDSPGVSLRQTAIARVAGHFAWSNPEAASTWATELPAIDQTPSVMHSIGGKWGARDGEAAVEWASSLDADSPGRQNALQSAFEGWAHSNPSEASEFLSSMGSSPDRDQAIGGFVSRHRWENPEAAILWATEITDSGSREDALVKAGRAYFRTDPTGAAAWLGGSGLSPEAQTQVVKPPKNRDGDRSKRR